MGLWCVPGYEKPALSSVVCLRKDLVATGNVGSLIWNDKGTGADMDGSFWNIDIAAGSIKTGTFAGANKYDPSFAAPLCGINNGVV